LIALKRRRIEKEALRKTEEKKKSLFQSSTRIYNSISAAAFEEERGAQRLKEKRQ